MASIFVTGSFLESINRVSDNIKNPFLRRVGEKIKTQATSLVTLLPWGQRMAEENTGASRQNDEQHTHPALHK